jgi:hypothetical protein
VSTRDFARCRVAWLAVRRKRFMPQAFSLHPRAVRARTAFGSPQRA